MNYSGFDAFHRPTSRTLTYPNGNTETVSLTYDHEGEDTLTAGGTQLVETIGYNDMGQLKRLALGNGLTTWYGYMGYEGSGNHDTYDAKEVTWNWGANESFGRLWRICTASDANTRCEAANKDLTASGQVLDMRYSYDNVGNVAAIRDYLNSNQVSWFGYDYLNRLTSAYTDSVGVGQYNHTYGYNKLGNLDNYDGAAYTYSTSHKQAVATAQGTTFSYDANGNMTFRDNTGTTNDYTHNFNVENELSSVVVNGQTTSFTYDAAGIRVKTVEPSGKILYYPFPGYIEEVNGSTTIRRVTYSLAGQAVATRVQTVGGSNTLYYLHNDHIGSRGVMTNSSGGTVSGSTAHYYPFGDWRTEPTAGITTRGFTGHISDNTGTNDIGLIYMNARYYLPNVGRFISPDTLIPSATNPQSYNRYSYTFNNPMRYNDPSGHCPWCVGAVVGFVVGAAVDYGAQVYGNMQEGMSFSDALTTDIDVGEVVAAGAVGAVVGGTLGLAAPAIGTAATTAGAYVGAGISYAQTGYIAASVAYPTATAVVTGVAETAGECAMVGYCTAGDYAWGAATAGLASVSARSAAGDPCHSFSGDTLVATEEGLQPISELEAGDLVLAYDETTEETDYHPIEATWLHLDPVIVHLTIDGEIIETTPSHPFYTEEGWVEAGNLHLGASVRSATGWHGTVEAIQFVLV